MLILTSRRSRLSEDSSVAKTAKKRRLGPVLQQLKGWQQVGAFLGQPVSIVQHWAQEGMPVKKQGRFIIATPEELDRWLGQAVGVELMHVAEANTHLTTKLKRIIKGGKSTRK